MGIFGGLCRTILTLNEGNAGQLQKITKNMGEYMADTSIYTCKKQKKLQSP